MSQLWFKGSTKAKKSCRKQWETINEIDALAWSSNVYMFRIAMLLGGAELCTLMDALNVDAEAFCQNSLYYQKGFG